MAAHKSALALLSPFEDNACAGPFEDAISEQDSSSAYSEIFIDAASEAPRFNPSISEQSLSELSEMESSPLTPLASRRSSKSATLSSATASTPEPVSSQPLDSMLSFLTQAASKPPATDPLVSEPSTILESAADIPAPQALETETDLPIPDHHSHDQQSSSPTITDLPSMQSPALVAATLDPCGADTEVAEHPRATHARDALFAEPQAALPGSATPRPLQHLEEEPAVPARVSPMQSNRAVSDTETGLMQALTPAANTSETLQLSRKGHALPQHDGEQGSSEAAQAEAAPKKLSKGQKKRRKAMTAASAPPDDGALGQRHSAESAEIPDTPAATPGPPAEAMDASMVSASTLQGLGRWYSIAAKTMTFNLAGRTGHESPPVGQASRDNPNSDGLPGRDESWAANAPTNTSKDLSAQKGAFSASLGPDASSDGDMRQGGVPEASTQDIKGDGMRAATLAARRSIGIRRPRLQHCSPPSSSKKLLSLT